jgi:hypothetical protein
LLPSDEILRETLIRTGLKDVCEFLSAVPLELNVPIPLERVAAVHRYLSEPRLRVVADRDDRYSGNGVEAFDHVVVVYVVGLVENHDKRVLNGVSEELMDTVNGSAPGELIADVCRMLAECLAKDRAGTLTKASDMGVGNGGALFNPIESVSRDHRFTDTTGTADQGIVWGRSGQRGLKRTRKLTHLRFAVYQLLRQVNLFEDPRIDDHDG